MELIEAALAGKKEQTEVAKNQDLFRTQQDSVAAGRQEGGRTSVLTTHIKDEITNVNYSAFNDLARYREAMSRLFDRFVAACRGSAVELEKAADELCKQNSDEVSSARALGAYKAAIVIMEVRSPFCTVSFFQVTLGPPMRKGPRVHRSEGRCEVDARVHR